MIVWTKLLQSHSAKNMRSMSAVVKTQIGRMMDQRSWKNLQEKGITSARKFLWTMRNFSTPKKILKCWASWRNLWQNNMQPNPRQEWKYCLDTTVARNSKGSSLKVRSSKISMITCGSSDRQTQSSIWSTSTTKNVSLMFRSRFSLWRTKMETLQSLSMISDHLILS